MKTFKEWLAICPVAKDDKNRLETADLYDKYGPAYERYVYRSLIHKEDLDSDDFKERLIEVLGEVSIDDLLEEGLDQDESEHVIKCLIWVIERIREDVEPVGTDDKLVDLYKWFIEDHLLKDVYKRTFVRFRPGFETSVRFANIFLKVHLENHHFEPEKEIEYTKDYYGLGNVLANIIDWDSFFK